MNKFKGRDSMEMGVIYNLSCNNSAQIYIGQTIYNVTKRMKQHKGESRKPKLSRAADHTLNNKYHVVDFKKPEIIGRENHRERREMIVTIISL